MVVDYLTKVQISQQITTNGGLQRDWLGCRLPYKGTNFSANHNAGLRLCFTKHVVDYLTKVQISQQITTYQARPWSFSWLSITLQRYKFLSK